MIYLVLQAQTDWNLQMLLLYIFTFLLITFIVGYCIVCKFFNKSPYNKGLRQDVIIIPGYPANKDGSLSPILRERVYTAAKLYHSNIAPTIICSGGAVANCFVEADIMAQALVDLNVPTHDILIENASTNTYGNFILADKIMKEKEFKTAVIVSSPWHLRKASTYASRLNIDHTVEQSKIPREYLPLGIVAIYLYAYTQLLISNIGHCISTVKATNKVL